MAIKKYTIQEMKKMKSQTDWKYLENIKDADIDMTDSDAPDMMTLKERLRPIEHPKNSNPQQSITIRVDADAVEKLRKTGAGWQARLSKQISLWASKSNHSLDTNK